MFRNLILAAAAAILLGSCKPQPVDIDVPQQSGAIIISSSCPNPHSVYVSASYSVNSLIALADTVRTKEGLTLPRELLIDSAIVTLRSEDGSTDTLRKITDGIWGRNDLPLHPGARYQLTVFDHRKGKGASSSTVFLPQPIVDSMIMQRNIRSVDTSVRLQLVINNVASGSYFIVCYNSLKNVRDLASSLPFSNSEWASAPKRIELLTAENMQNGRLKQSLLLQAKAVDTLMVSIAQVDRASYEYFSAYKRTGSFINQLTGEPINLPGNILGGIGLFSLYQPLVRVFDLNRM